MDFVRGIEIIRVPVDFHFHDHPVKNQPRTAWQGVQIDKRFSRIGRHAAAPAFQELVAPPCPLGHLLGHGHAEFLFDGAASHLLEGLARIRDFRQSDPRSHHLVVHLAANKEKLQVRRRVARALEQVHQQGALIEVVARAFQQGERRSLAQTVVALVIEVVSHPVENPQRLGRRVVARRRLPVPERLGQRRHFRIHGGGNLKRHGCQRPFVRRNRRRHFPQVRRPGNGRFNRPAGFRRRVPPVGWILGLSRIWQKANRRHAPESKPGLIFSAAPCR